MGLVRGDSVEPDPRAYMSWGSWIFYPAFTEGSKTDLGDNGSMIGESYVCILVPVKAYSMFTVLRWEGSEDFVEDQLEAVGTGHECV